MPVCVARLLEGAQARRAGWTTLVPTSLGLEIEAICQVSLVPLKYPEGHQGRNSKCLPTLTLTSRPACGCRTLGHWLPTRLPIFSNSLCISDPSPKAIASARPDADPALALSILSARMAIYSLTPSLAQSLAPNPFLFFLPCPPNLSPFLPPFLFQPHTKPICSSISNLVFCLSVTLSDSKTTSLQKQEMAGSGLSSPLCGVWQWEEVINEPQEETDFPSEVPAGGQVSSEGYLRPLESRTWKRGEQLHGPLTLAPSHLCLFPIQ